MTKKRTRKDAKLESEGAEFLVLGRLLFEKITAFKTYTNFPGYDLIATSADHNTSARIQGVKAVIRLTGTDSSSITLTVNLLYSGAIQNREGMVIAVSGNRNFMFSQHRT